VAVQLQELNCLSNQGARDLDTAAPIRAVTEQKTGPDCVRPQLKDAGKGGFTQLPRFQAQVHWLSVAYVRDVGL